MAGVDVWMAELRRIWDDRFDRLDQYLQKIQNNNT